jgi:hypothetical protein
VPYSTRKAPREPGVWRGRVALAADFDETDVRLIEDFEA